jgi:asparagine synthase (glutamine-hydrolysing)
MSILWGVIKDRGASVGEVELRSLSVCTQRYATGDTAVFVHGRVGMGLQPYLSHTRSCMDTQPFPDAHGNVLCFDGRLDNYQELAKKLGIHDAGLSDSAIVLAAFERWGEDCFAQLTGDWALALWCEREQKLLLAKDHAGTRSLYFSKSSKQIQWATYLDTFPASGATLRLSEEYAAAYLSCSPVQDRTPYANIRSVLPGHYVVVREGVISQKAHWSPVIRASIQYRTDAEYDEHFLSVFGKAVARRGGSGEPILAQLSGGMDSTSIVCMSDSMRRSADPQAKLLDTISFFDDSETSLDERRYFSITESQRGKTGIHLDVAFSQRTFEEPQSEAGRYQFPGADGFSLKQESVLFHAVWESGYRSILSGIGGDEVLGGIPNGLPELADYLVSGKFKTLLTQAVAWALPDRDPLAEILYRTIRYTTRIYARKASQSCSIPSWMCSELRSCLASGEAATGMVPSRLGIAPHRLDNALTWWRVMETLPHLSPQLLFRPEYRYPMLDKDLVEYLFSIPPEQLVRPGRRRAMMRRALRGIVPVEILERRRKAFQHRAPLRALRDAYPELRQSFRSLALAEVGFIDADAFRAALKETVDGGVTSYHSILRTIAYELWLRGADSGVQTAGAHYAKHFGGTSLVMS